MIERPSRVRPGVGGTWWRFDGYEVRAGYLRPRARATLTPYDPWETFNSSDGGPRPYERLHALDLQSESAVIEWCRSFGLLGVLLEESDRIELAMPSRDVPDADEAESLPVWNAEPDDSGEQPLATVYAHTLSASGWNTLGISEHEHEAPSWKPRATHRALSVPNQRSTRARPALTWGRYFPDVPERFKDEYPYPLPLTERFWRGYAESADTLARARAVLDRVASEAAEGRCSFANEFLASVRPRLLGTTKGFGLQWPSTSLLSQLVMMQCLDLESGKRRAIRCATCGVVALAAGYQTTYCSTRCRWAGQKQRQRKRSRRSRRNLH